MTQIIHKYLLVLPILIAACGVPRNEPTDTHLRGAFERHKAVIEDMRRMFEEDMKRRQLVMVSATGNTRCEDRRIDCIDVDRLKEYATKLNGSRIQRIELHETPGIYFHIHRTIPTLGWSGGYRYRGLVYAPGSPKVTHNHDDTEERLELGDGWYAYLIIDD